jgi:succinoglycan biosynthesis transport protein ExoP
MDSGMNKMNNDNDYIEIDLRELFFALLRKWWFILLCFVITTGITFVVTFYYIVPVYQAETTLFLGKEKDSIGGITFSDLQLGNQLIVDYREIIKSNLVTEEVISKLNLDMDIKTFKERVEVTTITDSRIFRISFESTDPQLAADVANELAQVISEKAAEIIEVKNVSIIDVAKVPEEPIKPKKLKSMAVAALVGVLVGVLIIIILELLDNTFKKPEDVEKKLGTKVIGSVPQFEGYKKKKKLSKQEAKERDRKNLITLLNPKSPAAEAYRAMRTNIHYCGIDKELKTIVVTSPGPSDGKTTTSCNLAISFAQNGKKVLLIDADLRKAKVHKYFDLPNHVGLTNCLVDNVDPSDAIMLRKDIPNLHFILAGHVPPNPAELLGSNKMKELLEKLQGSFDVIVIDTPPVMNVTDSTILAGMADGIILVVSAGETNIEIAREALKTISEVGTKILGTALVKIDAQSVGSYYRYYSYEYK